MLFLNLYSPTQFIMIICTVGYLIISEQTASSVIKNGSYTYSINSKSSEYLKMNSLQRRNFNSPDKLKLKSDLHQIHRVNRSRKDANTRLPSVEECISDQYNYAVIKGCLCYLFQSTGLSNGTFEYLTKIQRKLFWNTTKCLIYTFVGDIKEIVHIRLLEFSLTMRRRDSVEKKCTTKFNVYHQLERAELINGDKPDYVLCGTHLNQLPVDEFYSIGRVLIIEINEIIGTIDNRQKFIGLFEFLDKDAYRSDGLPIKSTKCDRIFFSSSYGTQNESVQPPHYPNTDQQNNEGLFLYSKTNGKFFSPNYPQFYNASMTCKYYFLAGINERILIKLNRIHLWSYQTCHSSPQRDTVHFHEITTPLTDSYSGIQLNNIAKTPPVYTLGKRLLFLCGYEKEAEVVSDGLFVMLTLQTHDKSFGARGFEGSYHFLSKEKSVSQHNKNRKIDEELYRDPAVKELTTTESDKEFLYSTNQAYLDEPFKPQGTIESPNYPSVYPKNTRFLYIINIQVGKSVQLKFLDLQLGDSLTNTKCSQQTGDRIEIYEHNYSNRHQPKLILCGKSTYENEILINNPGDEMTRVYILFNTDSIITKDEHGFVLSYKFMYQNLSVSFNTNYYNYNDNHNNNKYNLVRKDLSDETTEMMSRSEDQCQFTITSNGKDSNGYIQMPRDFIIGQKSFESGVHNKFSSCIWRLQGGYGQRIQIRFVKRLESLSYKFQNLFNNQHKSVETDDVHGPESSFINSLRCPTSVTLELVNYRPNILTTNNDISNLLNSKFKTNSASQQKYSPMNLETIFVPSSISVSSTSQSTDSNHQFPIPSDPVRLCAGDFMIYSPASKGFMSGSIPRLDIILRINQSVGNVNSDRFAEQNYESLSFPNLGYDVRYRFVTDYGVTTSFGNQRKPGCFFEFKQSQSTKGNFSSPNYPGLYPIDLICEYRFFGINVKRIDITFLEFDVESTSKTCTDDSMGDSVEISSCYPVELLTTPKRRLCHKQSQLNPYKIQWYEPCLNLKFFSNGMYVRTGFFGVYEFHDAGQIGRKINRLLIIFLCFIVNSLSHLIIFISQ
ncbi:unnamed protein product [Heterobilharzia americana]|nr:unnamed protein product [Heterobilharzia americana]